MSMFDKLFARKKRAARVDYHAVVDETVRARISKFKADSEFSELINSIMLDRVLTLEFLYMAMTRTNPDNSLQLSYTGRCILMDLAAGKENAAASRAIITMLRARGVTISKAYVNRHSV